jgi:hypothetical protein
MVFVFPASVVGIVVVLLTLTVLSTMVDVIVAVSVHTQEEDDLAFGTALTKAAPKSDERRMVLRILSVSMDVLLQDLHRLGLVA